VRASRGVISGGFMSVDVMAELKWLLLALAAAALSGCSAGFNPPLPGSPTAWQVAGHPPRDKTEGPARKSARILRPKTEIIVGSIYNGAADPTLKPYSKEWFAKQEALDRVSDAALSKKMTICRGCLSPHADLDLVPQSVHQKKPDDGAFVTTGGAEIGQKSGSR